MTRALVIASAPSGSPRASTKRCGEVLVFSSARVTLPLEGSMLGLEPAMLSSVMRTITVAGPSVRTFAVGVAVGVSVGVGLARSSGESCVSLPPETNSTMTAITTTSARTPPASLSIASHANAPAAWWCSRRGTCRWRGRSACTRRA